MSRKRPILPKASASIAGGFPPDREWANWFKDAHDNLQDQIDGLSGAVSNITGLNTTVAGLPRKIVPAGTGFFHITSNAQDADAKLVEETDLSFTDITTGNASSSKHGLLPKLSNSATQYLDGTGAFSTPGGGGAAGVGAQIGYTRTASTTVASTTDTSIPASSSIPTNTQGVAYASLDTTYTPSAATSLLEVEVTIPYLSGSTAATPRFSLFRDSGANAIYATFADTQNNASQAFGLVMRVVVAAGSTSATTFKVRWCSGGGTAEILQLGGTNFFGASAIATMTVKEIKQ